MSSKLMKSIKKELSVFLLLAMIVSPTPNKVYAEAPEDTPVMTDGSETEEAHASAGHDSNDSIVSSLFNIEEGCDASKEASEETPAEETPSEERNETVSEEIREETVTEASEEAPDEENPAEEFDGTQQKETLGDAQTLTAAASDGAVITVDAPAGALPEGSYVTAVPVPEEAILPLIEGAEEVAAYDITIYDAYGIEVQPEKPVSIQIMNAPITTADAVYHVDDSMTEATLVTDEINVPEDSFTTDHFSIYVLSSGFKEDGNTFNGVTVGSGTRDRDMDGKTITLHIGDTIVLTDSYTFSSTASFYQDTLYKWNNGWHIWDNTTPVGSGDQLELSKGAYYDRGTGYVHPYLKLTVRAKPRYTLSDPVLYHFICGESAESLYRG